MTDLIDYVLRNKLTVEDKCKLKDKRPIPYIPMTLKEKNQQRIFQLSWYHKYNWLTGSIKNKKLYCFHCLLFGGDEDWTSEGISTIKNIDNRAQRHQVSRVHIRNSELFHMLGKELQVSQIISESARKSVCLYNEKVTANRRVLSRLIQAVIYLSSQRLPIFGKDSPDEGHYNELINFTAQEEPSIRDYLSNSDLKLNTDEAQGEILKSIKTAVMKRIKEEVSAASYVSFQVDETSDVSCRSQISLIFRYCLDDKIVERFIGFYEVMRTKGAMGLREVLFKVLADWSVGDKLVSQSYDGAMLMSEPAGYIQDLVSERYLGALALHSVHHSLPLALLHGSKSILPVKRFIADLAAFENFFDKSSQRIGVIAEKCLKLPLESITHWNFRSNGVTTILAHYTDFLRILEEISESNAFEFDSYTYGCAIGLKQRLTDPIFVYLLFLFQEIFFFTDQIANAFQTYSTRNAFRFQKELKSIIAKVISLKSEETVSMCIEYSKNLNDSLDYYGVSVLSLTYEVINSQVTHLEKRFAAVLSLQLLEVLNEQAFPRYNASGNFPEASMQRLNEQYWKNFQLDQLRNELCNIFADREKHLPPEQLLKCLYVNGLNTVYTETTKFLHLVLTLPVIRTVDANNTLKVIKSYLKKCVADERLSNLGILAVEKSLLGDLSRDIDFINEVIDIFGTNNEVDLQYKRM